MAAVAQLEAASKERYPQYWEELEGIVEGSGLPRELVGSLSSPLSPTPLP